MVTSVSPDHSFHHPRYRALQWLGRGGQGRVARVVDIEQPTRPLVAKIYTAGVFDPELLEGEFALLSRLRIPGLVRAYDLGRDEATGAVFLVEDFVDGPDAVMWIREAHDDSDRARRLVELIAYTAVTLSALHDAGFVHGDLKPAHLRIASGSRPVMLDLGAAVARACTAAARAVSHGYTAPEVLAGAPPSPASDLFAFGATLWAAATGSAPSSLRDALRRKTPWVPPSIERLIAALLAEHPQDRPAGARELLSELAQSPAWSKAAIAPNAGFSALMVGRERELSRLLRAPPGVHYVSGAPGLGKTQLLRELVTRLLLKGRAARLVSFPCSDSALVAELVAFFRGASEAWPFALPSSGVFVLALDELHRSPEELVSALEAYRCRPGREQEPVVIAAMREAPPGVESLKLGALEENALRELVETAVTDEERVTQLLELGRGNPGVLVAALGRVPLNVDAAREHLRALSPEAKALLGALAVSGGELPRALCERLVERPLKALAELQRRALVLRRFEDGAERCALTAPTLSPDLAAALSSFDLVDALTAELLRDNAAWPAELLLCVAAAPTPPARRTELLTRAAERARVEGLRSLEADALFALGADPNQRTPELLVELDRVTRGGGSSGLHPELLRWLEDGAGTSPVLEPLALRRRADERARQGDYETACELSHQAQRAAIMQKDPVAEGLALAMTGAIELYRANWPLAERALNTARSLLAGDLAPDAEEAARIDHNLGVVALYRGRIEEAVSSLERSLSAKRKMGDRGGIWACLLNLGLAYSKLGRFEAARRALQEAGALTRSLGQTAGTAWCLLARAEVEIKSGRATEAEQWLAETESLGDQLPAAARADLVLAHAEVALLEQDGPGAMKALASLEPALRRDDPLCDTRAQLLESQALLLTLPVDRFRAARLAIGAIRRARSAELAEQEAQANECLRRARRAPTSRASHRAETIEECHSAMQDKPLESSPWPLLENISAGISREKAAVELCNMVVRFAGAERAFVVIVDPHGSIQQAWGADIDGIGIGHSIQRVPVDLLNQSLDRTAPVYQRDSTTAGGRGSALAVSTAPLGAPLRAVVIAQHRFATGQFDGIGAEQLRKWATLAQLLVRVTSDGAEETADRTGDASSVQPPFGAPPPETTTLLPALESSDRFRGIVGSSPSLRTALGKLAAAVQSDLPLLIVGETGTGKELFARAAHEHGARAGKPFVAVNCAAIPESLFEAELFGHERGSFTGAERSRPGLFARAQGGTLFLDEVGEVPLSRQAVLLRALESATYRPVGADAERPFDVRFVSATNRDLKHAAAAGQFRSDLLYRLNVLEVRVPPLRERPGDVTLLARDFLARQPGGAQLPISSAALEALESYSWPGNVRELEHDIQRLAAARLQRIELVHLPREIRAAAKSRAPAAKRVRAVAPENERAQVTRALEATGGNITHAAARLGLTRHGLKKKMFRLGIRSPSTAVGPSPQAGNKALRTSFGRAKIRSNQE